MKTVTDHARLLEAVHFAAGKHRQQTRKDAAQTPYINHPIAVATLMATVGGIDDVDTLLAALLHDTVEDTETTFEELDATFGPSVRAIVAEVTDDKSLPKARRKELQVEHTPHMSVAAKQIKLADKSCNLNDLLESPPPDWPIERRQAYFTWAESVVAGARGANPALEAHFDTLLAQGKDL